MPPGLTSPAHLLVVLMVALIVLGPEQLPDALRKVGRFLGEVQRWSEGLKQEMNHLVTVEPDRGSPDTQSSTNASHDDNRPVAPDAPQESP